MMIHAQLLDRGLGAARSPTRRSAGGRLLEGNRAPCPRVLHDRRSQSITARWKMTAGENRREVSCLGRMSRLVLRGRALPGWWRYTDLAKYR